MNRKDSRLFNTTRGIRKYPYTTGTTRDGNGGNGPREENVLGYVYFFFKFFIEQFSTKQVSIVNTWHDAGNRLVVKTHSIQR